MAATGMGIFLATIDGSIVNVALPTLVRAFDTTFASVQWVVLSYLLTVTTLMLSIGRLGDMVGKKPIYASGFVVFTAGSVLCGLSPTIGWLIGFRIVQAIGASMLMALGMAIVIENFPPSQRGKALGISGSLVSIGIVIGPVLGGLILGALSWHWIFYVNLPVGIAGTWMVMRFVPHSQTTSGQHFDLAGAVALFTSLTSLLLALNLGQQSGFGQPRTLGLMAFSLAVAALFVFLEMRSHQPMIDLRLFRNVLFDVNLVTGFLTFVCTSGMIILLPFYLEEVLGYAPQVVGFMLAVVPITVGITAPLSGTLSDRVGTRPMTVVGLVSLVIGFSAVSTLKTDTTTLGYLLRFVPVGIGIGLFQSPNNSAVMGTVPRTRLGVASSLLSITRTLGQTTGIAVMSALWAGRVATYLGGHTVASTTTAPAAIQVTALNETVRVAVALLTLGLILAAWGLIYERRQVRRASAPPTLAATPSDPAEQPPRLSP
jgi:EmrB/QacA subfamily drug resistance transporter